MKLSVKDHLFRWFASDKECEGFEASLSSLGKLKSYTVYYDMIHGGNLRNGELFSKIVFAHRKPFLENLILFLNVLDSDLTVAITPSLLGLQHLSLSVFEMKLEEMVRLFEASPKLKTVSFGVFDRKVTTENALDFVTKIMKVPWMKENLGEVKFKFWAWNTQFHYNVGWTADQKRKFVKDFSVVVQKLRLRRCVVKFDEMNFVE